MTTKAKPAVGYVRMSTDKQEDSPAQQKAEITKLAQREGYRILRWYEDHGISGAKTLKRPEFRRMIREAEERGDFKAILCWDQDRFGRFDSIEAGEWISPLRRVGVELVTVCQGRIDWEDFAGRLIYQITQEGKHRFLVDLSRNALRGMIRFAKQGHLLGKATPYGYDRQYFNAAGEEVCRIKRGERFHKPRDWWAKLVPSSNPQEVETVRWMFRTFATTAHSTRWLGVELNRRKVPSPGGKEWEYSHIKTLLKHPVYLGWLTYGRQGAGLYHHVGADGELTTARGQQDHGGNYAPIIVRDNHEPLIDQATFDAVQAKLKERSIVRGGPTRKHMLSGILRCGHCGGILVGSAGSPGSAKREKPYVYYKCKRARVSGTCENYAVRADFIEPEMVACFRSAWRTDAGRKALRKALASLAAETLRTRPERRDSLLAQTVKLEQQIAKGTQNLLLLAPADIPAASALLAEWRQQRDALQSELDHANENQPVTFDADAVLAELDELEQHLTGDSATLAKTAFQRVFEKVSLYWETVSPRRRELVRAEITPRFPFCLTVGTLIPRKKPTRKPRASRRTRRRLPTNTPAKARTGKPSCVSARKNWPS